MGCSDGGNESASLEQPRRELIEALGLLPVAGQNSPTLGSAKHKTAPRYLTATGRLSGTTEEALEAVRVRVVGAGFSPAPPLEAQPNIVAAVREDLVAQIAVYDRLGSLPEEQGMTFVQLQLGRQDPALVWTQVRPG